MISNLVSSNSKFNLLQHSLDDNEKVSVFGCSFGEKIAIILEQTNKVVLLAKDENEAYEFGFELELNNMRVIYLTKPFNYELNQIISHDLNIQKSLIGVVNGEFDVLILTPETIGQKYPTKAALDKSICFVKNKEYDLNEIIEKLVALNYKRVGQVFNCGEFSLKGDVLDIYPIGSASCKRFMFDFDELKSIKNIDLESLNFSEYEGDSFAIYSNNLLSLNAENLKEKLQSLVKKGNSILNETLAEALLIVEQNSFNSNMWFSVFDENISQSIFNLIDEHIFIITDAKAVFINLQNYYAIFNNTLKEAINNGKMLSVHNCLELNENQFEFNINLPAICFQHITNANKFFKPNKIFSFVSMPVPNYYVNRKVLFLDLSSNISNGVTTLICVKSKESLESLSRELESHRINFNKITLLSQAIKGSVNVIVKNYHNSFFFLDEKICVIGLGALFGERKVVKTQNVVSFEDAFIPSDGDFVVHRIHGIGKCLGLKSLNVNGTQKDYFIIEYKNNDKLFVPCENVDSISKYVGSDSAPTLNKMGGIEFANIKQRVKNKVKEMAFSLVELYAKRQNLKGFKYPKDDELQEAFENSFSYNETLDQLNAVKDIKNDMESGKVMDRLVCGDVGFGKTEVAIRCAFKTICAGKMVAFLCPTTILSEQHYHTCVERMANFGVRIDVLNRFRTNAEVEEIYKRLERGEVDLIIGTHKLLNKHIVFKNLGLLILDEEQKFGVEDKEKLKNLKNDINILTLSATPIPRTLNLSLSGIRDISVIQTPPTSRIPAEVQVCELNENLVKSAIEREVSRSGQVLIIYNRVESIYAFAKRIKDIIGNEIKLSVAHGQMTEKELETEVIKLYNQETQVLISTTLIENGVDLPNANTIIVVNADQLGLSQLYQLKGRIGRSDRQAYAYFTYDGNKVLSENAYKRLEAISEFTSMGSGFKIAVRDLEIRGAGNVLGVEQHGHMQKVGYAMYVELLKQAISEVKGEKVESEIDVKVETNISAFIANEFVEKYEQRISLYMAISKIKSKEDYLRELTRIKEVYGDLPIEILNLMKIALIKNIASMIGVFKVVIKNTLELHFVNLDLFKEKFEKIKDSNYNFVLNFEKEPIIEMNLSRYIDSKLDITLEIMENLISQNKK